MPDSISLNIRMWTSKPDKVMEKVILNLGWEWTAASKACEYSRKVLKKRWPQAENIIKKVPYQSYLYARHVVRGRWEEAEASIAKCSNSSYLYAKYVLNDRFILGENKKIWKHPRDIYLYSKYVLKSRWLEKEKIIERYVNKNSNRSGYGYELEDAMKYLLKVKKEPWPALEDAIVQGGSFSGRSFMFDYYKILKNPEEKEIFYNKVLAQSLVDPAYSWQKNYAAEFIKMVAK